MRTEDLRVAMLSLHGHNRISLNFRFWEGAQVLDAGSYSNIRFLTRFIYRCHFEGERLFLWASATARTALMAI